MPPEGRELGFIWCGSPCFVHGKCVSQWKQSWVLWHPQRLKTDVSMVPMATSMAEWCSEDHPGQVMAERKSHGDAMSNIRWTRRH